MESLDHKDLLGSVERMDSVDHLVLMASLDLLDQEENLDPRDHKDLQVCQMSLHVVHSMLYTALDNSSIFIEEAK